MTDPSPSTSYQVLARKYRPETFADLRGQDAMVRTLKNAFEADRIAHAFILTGIRGTGKTTTARIIAKGLNCVGPDGKGQATIEPCGQCDQCTAIIAGRHVDVLEMDAASRTGVGDIREIIDSVHYRAATARFKIYIIDEVHMLSTSAFNALLKTLEEPPAHVKFIFATTEIRKVPVTVLSRCQRFDLRRIEPEVLIDHLKVIAALENAELADDALSLIVRAAEGSARDAMSLLDQAIAHGAGETSAEQVRAMLGLADRGRVLDLFQMILKGDAAGALVELSSQYADGADPMAVLKDLAEVTHWLSVVKISPEAADDPTISPDERDRGISIASDLPMRALTRTWQMLLKALEEVALAPNSMMAAEMAIIRLTHVVDLPSPEELLRKLQNQDPVAPPPTPPMSPSPSSSPTDGGSNLGPIGGGSPSFVPQGGPSGSPVAQMAPAEVDALSRFARFEDVVAMIRANRDMTLLFEVESSVCLAKYQPGRIEFELTAEASTDLPTRLARKLQMWTGVRWGVTVVTSGGGETINSLRQAQENDLRAQVMAHPMVQAAILAFPGAQVHDVIRDEDIEANAISDEMLEAQDADDWDPFED
jgi:DNA polymerase-3 subunit gamma/tau